MPSRSAEFLISTVYTCMSENCGLNETLLDLDGWQVIFSCYKDFFKECFNTCIFSTKRISARNLYIRTYKNHWYFSMLDTCKFCLKKKNS